MGPTKLHQRRERGTVQTVPQEHQDAGHETEQLQTTRPSHHMGRHHY